MEKKVARSNILPSYYEFANPVKILSGKNALDNIPYELEQMSAKRPIVITDKGVVKAGLIKFIKNAFKGSGMSIGAIYDDVPPDSSTTVVNSIAKLYREKGCDSIIAVGGGSPMDTAKGVNIVITEKSDDLMQFMGAEQLKKPLQPLIAVPTTSGTGSEVTFVAVIADKEKNIKMAFTSYHLLPRVAVLDPRMTLTVPPKITAATGMDALTHAIEAYICIQKNPISDAYAFAAIKLIKENLMKTIRDGGNEQARLAMANAATLAGTAFSNSMVGMVHSLGHAVGGVCHVPHGMAMSIFLPHGLEYNLSHVNHLIGELLLPIGGSEKYAATPKAQRASQTIEIIREMQRALYKNTGLPYTLREAGVSKDKLPEVAKAAINDGSLTFNPVEVDYDDALRVLNRAY